MPLLLEEIQSLTLSIAKLPKLFSVVDEVDFLKNYLDEEELNECLSTGASNHDKVKNLVLKLIMSNNREFYNGFCEYFLKKSKDYKDLYDTLKCDGVERMKDIEIQTDIDSCNYLTESQIDIDNDNDKFSCPLYDHDPLSFDINQASMKLEKQEYDDGLDLFTSNISAYGLSEHSGSLTMNSVLNESVKELPSSTTLEELNAMKTALDVALNKSSSSIVQSIKSRKRRIQSLGNDPVHVPMFESPSAAPLVQTQAGTPRIYNAVRPFKCHICNKAFTQRGSLNYHIRTHTGEKPFECQICHAKFAQNISLTNHMRVHSAGGKIFECQVCSKKFQESGTLACHMRVHTGEEHFRCPQCNKTFMARMGLIVHIRRHNGEKPYRCNICPNSFTSRSGLNSHMRTHMGQSGHQCTICYKSFSGSSSLNCHMRLHSGERPFACRVCGKKFATNGNLTSHLRVHTGEKPYPCSICGQRFSHNFSLTSHLRTHSETGT